MLLHGATGAHWSFRYILPLLVERFTLYAVDRRGRGESGDATDYAIEREFEDVAAIVDSLAEPANVVGHSYGATVALGALLVTPNIERLVVYGPRLGSPSAARYLERIRSLSRRGAGGGAGLRPRPLRADFRRGGSCARADWPVRVGRAHRRARGARGGVLRLDADRFRDAPRRHCFCSRREPGLGARGTRGSAMPA